MEAAKQARLAEQQLKTARGAGTRGYRTFYRSRGAGRGRGGRGRGRGRGAAGAPGHALVAADQEEEGEEAGGKKMRFSTCEENDKNVIVKFIADSGALSI